MDRYVAEKWSEAVDVTSNHPWVIAMATALWLQIQTRFADFPASAPLFWMSAFWLADYVLGSLVAIRDSWVLGPNRWNPRRAFKGVLKWLCWVFVLAVTYGLRHSDAFGMPVISALIESVILATEASSAWRNAGRLTGAKWLERFSDGVDQARDKALKAALDKISLDDVLLEPNPNGRQVTQNRKDLTP